MIRKTDPEEIPRDNCRDSDSPPCVLDDGHKGGLDEPDDPLHGDRGGMPELRKHAMHEGEKEK